MAILTVLGLASCASKRHKPPEPEKKVICPQAEVLADAHSVVQFQPGTGRDLTDIEYQAEVGRLKSHCRHHRDDESMDISVEFTAWLGPAARGAKLSVPYFVAVTQGEDVLSKENFTVDLGFEKEARRTTGTGDVKRLAIPQTSGELPVEVLVGIQLTPEQVAYNRAHGS